MAHIPSNVPKKKMIDFPRVTGESLEKFKELWMGNKCRYVMFERTSDETIEITRTAGLDANYEDFLKAIPLERSAFAVLMFSFTLKGGAKRVKQAYVSYLPDTMHVEKKFVEKMAGGVLYKALQEISVSQFMIHANDIGDLDVEAVFQKVSRFEMDEPDYDAPVCADGAR